MDPPELEVLRAGPRRDVDDAGPLVERDVVPRNDAVLDVALRGQLVEGAAVAPADELLPAPALDERVVGEDVDGDPVAVLAPPVLRLRVHRRRDVRGQRPGRRRPDDE